MLIDPITVAAQIFNFLILVWLLKKFLFGRILKAVDAREQAIAASLSEAAQRERQASEQLAAYQKKVEEFETEKAGLLASARRDSEQQYAQMMEQARDEVRRQEQEWREALDRERAALLQEFRRRIADEVLGLVRRTLEDLTNRDLQEITVQAFLEQTATLSDQAKHSLGAGELQVRSAFALPEATRHRIQVSLEEQLARPVAVRFEQAAELGLGLEVRGDGWRIGWNAQSYLEALDQELERMLEEEHSEAGTS